MINKLISYYAYDLFKDESEFNILGLDGHVMVWRRKNEIRNTKNLVGRMKYIDGSVLLWGVMLASGQSLIWCLLMAYGSFSLFK